MNEIERTKFLIFLNRTCFNGLYRVNSKGHFNVPFGKYSNPTICNSENILADSELLNGRDTIILQGDYEETIKYIDETQPWVLGKEESTYPRLKTVLYNLVETIRILSVLLQAFIPQTAKKMQEQINASILDFDSIKVFGKTGEGKVEKPRSPGMKYRHYAPKAQLMIVEGETMEAVKAILDRTANQEMSDSDVDELKAAKEKLMSSAQALFTKMYESMQGAQGAGPDMGGAYQSTDAADDDIIDGDFREV